MLNKCFLFGVILVHFDAKNFKFLFQSSLPTNPVLNPYVNPQAWRDEFLTWNADDYNGIKQLHVKASSIWTPDITLGDK